jgi:hypothetical protein
VRLVRVTIGLATAGLLLGAVTAFTGGAAQASAPAVPGEASVDGPASALPDIRTLPQAARYPLDPNMAQTIAAWRKTPAGRLQMHTSAGAATAETPAVGTKRQWLSLDDEKGMLYLKEYTLRGVGKNIEVWVASGAAPDGVIGTDMLPEDCRRAVPDSTTVTDDQVKYLMNQYDTNMLPKESKAFSVAPDRDGTKKPDNDLTKGLDFTGAGNRVVTLVDNVRDANFYDFPKNTTYIAGFFSQQFNELADRNIMTIDAYDWAHRIGANVRDDQNSDICKSRPARPFTYEGIFAHEYQHLLQYYVDPAEVNFINEGLSDYAISLTGYGSTDKTVFEKNAESHIYCYEGFGNVITKYNPNGRPCGGPQNSLTLWGDEGDGSEILADYGNAWSFLLFLRDRYGDAMIESIHRDKAAQGLKSVQDALDRFGKGAKVASVLHDYQLMTLVDKIAGSKGGSITGIDKRLATSASLNSTVNLLNPAAYVAPGASPNGADFVPLRTTGIGYMSGADLRSVGFAGRRTLPPTPLKWTVAPRVPLLPTLSFPPYPNVPPIDDVPPPELPASPLDNPALFSGNEGLTDASAVFATTVPTDNPTLTYTTSYNMEDGFDYGYTVISTDGGKTYKTLKNANTKEAKPPAQKGDGLTGSAPLPTPQTFDLSAYKGQAVVLGFRYVSDPLVNLGGWYIDDVKVGNQLISDGSSRAPFKSFTQLSPTQVKNWSVQIVGLDENRKKVHVERVDGRFDFTLTPAQVKTFAAFPVVVAIVGFDEITETVRTYAPYALKVNGITQFGGVS